MKKTVIQMAKLNGVRWYGHVLRRDDGHVLRKALEFEVKGKSIGLEEDAKNQLRWRMGVREIAVRVG